MVDPIGSPTPRAMFAARAGEDRAAAERVQREFRALASACRTLAVAAPVQISRVTVSLPADGDAEAPERIVDIALTLAAAHGLGAEVEVSLGRVTVFFSRGEEES